MLLGLSMTPAIAGPVSAKDMRGKVVTLPAAPQRVVSLAPAVTEILFAIGAGGRVVGVTSYCDFPEAATRVPKIGDYRASIERVIARKPDLVVASASANAQVLPQLERLRVPLFVIDTQTVAQVLSPSKPRVLIVVDVNGPWVAGSHNYMDDIVTIAGGINVARDAGPGWRRYSTEKALMKQPDVLLVTDRDSAGVRRIPGWSKMAAVRENRVYGDLPIAFVRPGPRLPRALDHIARIFHGRRP
jgi:iron complex transport system substrate-binding protein